MCDANSLCANQITQSGVKHAAMRDFPSLPAVHVQSHRLLFTSCSNSPPVLLHVQQTHWPATVTENSSPSNAARIMQEISMKRNFLGESLPVTIAKLTFNSNFENATPGKVFNYSDPAPRDGL